MSRGPRAALRSRRPPSAPASASCARRAGRAGRTARVAERLEIEQDEVGRRRRPPTTRAGRSRRRQPCCRSRRTPRSRGCAPTPSRAARARGAPLCDENAIAPGGSAAGAKVAFSAEPAAPRSRGSSGRRAGPPCARDEREQPVLALAPSAPTSAKPAEITQERATPRRAPRRPRRGRGARQADHGEVDRARHRLRSTCSPARRATGSPSRLTGYAAPAKSAARTFRKTLAADRAAPARGADHGHGRRREEGAERGGDGEVVALVAGSYIAAASARSGSGPRTRRRRAHGSPSRPAPSKTPSIARFSGITSATKRSMPTLGRERGELLEQARPDPALLLSRPRPRKQPRPRSVAGAACTRQPRRL